MVRFDALLRRYFVVVVGLLLLASAYFHATGLSHLFGATLLDASPAVPKAKVPKIPATSEEEIDRPSGEPILARNPFDSITGPLVPGERESPAEEEPTNPLDDPRCELGGVTLIVWSEEEPDWSFAAIAGPDGTTLLRRRGDEIAGHRVEHIGEDRVWLARSDGVCQLEVHDLSHPKGMPPQRQRMPPPGMNEPPPQSAPPRTPARPSRDQLPPHIAARIQQTGPNQYDIDRTAVDEILTNQAALMRSVRIQPTRQGDQTTGMRIMGVKPGSALDAIGLQHGDQLQRINGFEMTNPQTALEAYARLQSASQIRVDVVRDGRPTTVELNIK